MFDIRTRPSVSRVLSRLENEPDLTLQKLAEDSQRIVSVRKDSKNIEESGVAYIRKVKHRSPSYSPIKERKKYDYPKFQYRQTSVNQKKPPRACYRCVKLHWAKDCPYRTKNVKTAINSDIRANSVKTEKELKIESDIQKARSQTKSFVNT